MCDKNTKAPADSQYDSPGFTVKFTGTIFKAITGAISSICDLLCAICIAIAALVIAVCVLLCVIIGLPAALLVYLIVKILSQIGQAKTENTRLTGIALQGGAEYNPPITDDDFQTIAEQIDELEGALMEWDIRGDGATARLP